MVGPGSSLLKEHAVTGQKVILRRRTMLHAAIEECVEVQSSNHGFPKFYYLEFIFLKRCL